MSTRAIYTFYGDQDAPRHVYKHHDGYPTGACEAIEAALGFAWTLPRYENDEFAAAFVAANKSHNRARLFELYRKAKKSKADRDAIKRYEGYEADGSGGGQVRLIAAASALAPAMEVAAQFAADAEFRYEIRCQDGELYVKAFATNYWDAPTETELWSGPLKQFRAWAEEYDKPDAA